MTGRWLRDEFPDIRRDGLDFLRPQWRRDEVGNDDDAFRGDALRKAELPDDRIVGDDAGIMPYGEADKLPAQPAFFQRVLEALAADRDERLLPEQGHHAHGDADAPVDVVAADEIFARRKKIPEQPPGPAADGRIGLSRPDHSFIHEVVDDVFEAGLFQPTRQPQQGDGEIRRGAGAVPPGKLSPVSSGA